MAKPQSSHQLGENRAPSTAAAVIPDQPAGCGRPGRRRHNRARAMQRPAAAGAKAPKSAPGPLANRVANRAANRANAP